MRRYLLWKLVGLVSGALIGGLAGATLAQCGGTAELTLVAALQLGLIGLIGGGALAGGRAGSGGRC